MPDLTFGTSAYDRERGNFPQIPVVNLVAEDTPTEQHTALISRPGLQNSGVTMGTGPVKALFQIDGVLNKGLFGISNGRLYSSGTDLGPIDGTGPAYLAGYADRVFANSGGSVWVYDGTSLGSVAMPGSFSVSSLCVGADRLIVVDAGTGRFYWSDPLTSTVQALNFATAENSPDNLRQCLFLGDQLILFGAKTVEFWPVNSNANLPFQPLVGRTFQVGIRDNGCATLWNGTFAWITDQNQICVTDINNIASNPGLNAKIEASTTAKLWTFVLDSNEFLACTIDNETWVLNPRTTQWSTFESFGHSNWVPGCYAAGYFGSSVDGNLIQWSNDYQDFGGTLERRFRAGMPTDAGTTQLFNVILRANPGHTPFLSGTYSNPTVELRTSKDNGETWSNWKPRSLGENGRYRQSIMWRSLGYFGPPSVFVEIRVTDPVPFRVSNVVANESYARI